MTFDRWQIAAVGENSDAVSRLTSGRRFAHHRAILHFIFEVLFLSPCLYSFSFVNSRHWLTWHLTFEWDAQCVATVAFRILRFLQLCVAANHKSSLSATVTELRKSMFVLACIKLKMWWPDYCPNRCSYLWRLLITRCVRNCLSGNVC